MDSAVVSLSDRDLSDSDFLSELIVPDNSVVGEIQHKGNVFIQIIHVSLKYRCDYVLNIATRDKQVSKTLLLKQRRLFTEE